MLYLSNGVLFSVQLRDMPYTALSWMDLIETERSDFEHFRLRI